MNFDKLAKNPIIINSNGCKEIDCSLKQSLSLFKENKQTNKQKKTREHENNENLANEHHQTCNNQSATIISEHFAKEHY